MDWKKKVLVTLIIVIIIVILIVAVNVIKIRKEIDDITPNPLTASWDDIKQSWPNIKGASLKTIINGDPPQNAVNLINATTTNNTKMTVKDADLLCAKACSGWSKLHHISKFCDCETNTSVNF